MKPHSADRLSRRERQIMDILYREGRASAADVLEALPDPPSYSAVRAMLRLLEEKGLVRHIEEGRKYVFEPAVARDRARRSALKNLLNTFFSGSAEQALASLLDVNETKLTDDELDRMQALIEQSRAKGEKS